jgi:hypothetical protein
MRDRLPFSHLLPLIDLALLVILVFVPITLNALHLYSASKGSDPVQLHSGTVEMTFPRSQIIPWSIRAATIPRARTMMAINAPGALFQWIISQSLSDTNASWHPQALALETWQALVFPFFALPFWWLAGCGLDGLVYKERLHWSVRVVGTILFALFLAAVIAFCFPMTASDRTDLTLPMRGVISWTIGFATLPAAWIAQSIRQRHAISSEVAPS